MLTKKTLGVALAGALALCAFSGSAIANPINVNGVHWDSSSPFDLTIQSLNLRESSVSAPGQVLEGYGQIGSINGDNTFCSGCDLTFTFTYTLDSITGNQVVFDNGSFQFYTQAAGSYDFGNPSSVNTTMPWVTLTGHTSLNAVTGATGDLFATVVGTAGNPGNGSNGFGLLDATSGPAAFWLDSNSEADGLGGFGDFYLASSFSTKPAKGCSEISPDPKDICHYPIQGNGSLIGQTAALNVPEPGPIGIMGLGLGVLGLFLSRRRKENDQRA